MVNQSFSLWLPLLLAGIAFAILYVSAQVVGGRGNRAGAERLLDIGFLIALLAGAWVVVLLLISLFQMSCDFGDMLVITLVIVVFFALLLGVFFGLSLVFRQIGRLVSRRKRVTSRIAWPPRR